MSTGSNLVLRTLYISPELDNKLRAEAFEKKTSKNDVIRNYLEYAIAQKKKEGIVADHAAREVHQSIKHAATKKMPMKKAAAKKAAAKKAAAKKA